MKSFLQGKKAIAVEPLRAPVPTGAPGPAASLCHAAGKAPVSVTTPGASSAHVEVIKEGDKVVRLVVTCVCGERVEIECLYTAGR